MILHYAGQYLSDLLPGFDSSVNKDLYTGSILFSSIVGYLGAFNYRGKQLVSHRIVSVFVAVALIVVGVTLSHKLDSRYWALVCVTLGITLPVFYRWARET